MKKHFIALFALLGCGVLSGASLHKVVVYPAQAQLFYRLDTQLASGEYTLVFRGLPHTIQAQSIRWRMPRNVQLLSWETRIFPLDPSAVPPSIRSLHDSLDHYTMLVDSFERLKQHYQWLAKMLQANWSVKGKEALLWEDVDEMFKYLDRKNQWLLLQISQAKAALARAREKQQYWKKRWETASRPYLKEGEIALHVRVTTRRSFRIGLDFLVRNASWTPEYRIRAYPQKGRLSWMLMGNIQQTTGKDWQVDTIILTNATPHQYLYVPRLTPWYLVIEEPGKKKTVATRTFDAAIPAMQKREAKATEASPTVSEQQQTLLHEFQVVHPPAVPSTGQRIPLVLRIISPQATFEYRLYPSRNENAILTALISNVDQYRLIRAQAKVFINGRYNGQVHINPFTTDNRLIVAMGSDERIKIRKKLISKQRRGPGLGGTITASYKYQYTLKNHYNWEVKTLTIDQIPISPDRRVKVSSRAGSGIEEAATGIVKWPYTLSGNGEKSWTLEFSVSYPKDLKVVNLP